MARGLTSEEREHQEAIAFDRDVYNSAPARDIITYEGVARLQMALMNVELVTHPDGHGVLLFPTEEQRDLAERTIKDVGSPWKEAHHIVTPLDRAVQRRFPALEGLTVQVPLVDELKLLLENKQLELHVAEAHTSDAFVRQLAEVNRQMEGAQQRTP